MSKIIDRATYKLLDRYPVIEEPAVDFYGIMTDDGEYVVVGYGHDPVRPVTGILARHEATSEGLVAAILEIRRRDV